MTTQLRVEPYVLPAADLGPENPLPMFRQPDPDQHVRLDPGVPEDDARYVGWQTAFRVLPYRMQDGYNRDRRPRSFTGLVLENETLRAVVLAELGGRLVSLEHRPTGRELLYRNPIFQPANLALRNAWFSGGIEWNLPHLGHHYLTCSPVFAAQIRGVQGEPALRIYEWDRLKGIPWQVDLHLPPGSPFLFAHVRAINPRDETIPMYWWTNIAVAEAPDVRVLAPAASAIGFPGGKLTLTPLPDVEGTDVSYSTRLSHAQEFFFRIDDGQRPWIAALDESGQGLFQASTPRLRGRKMFCWGVGRGGRHWQEYLGGPGNGYLEIQAGLARTQLESIPMPARAEWSWTEAFGLLQADPVDAHSPDWRRACYAAGAAVEESLPLDALEGYHGQFTPAADRPQQEILAAGSGWGALERKRLAQAQQPDPIPGSLPFPDSTLGREQQPWLELLDSGVFPESDPAADPGAYMVQSDWRTLLESSLSAGKSDHWLSWLHLGLMKIEAGDEPGARDAWEQSVRRRRSPWAFRNLAALEDRAGHKESALDWLRQAWDAGPPIPALAVEYTRLLLELGRQEELREFVAALPPGLRQHERIWIVEATAAIDEGRFEDAGPLFQREFTTIREGETTLTDLWFRLHEERTAASEGISVNEELRRRVREAFPPPAHIDYRMG